MNYERNKNCKQKSLEINWGEKNESLISKIFKN